MYYETNKEEMQAMMNMPGEIRGSTFDTDKKFILKKGGKKKLGEVEGETSEMGHALYYNKTKSKEFYPWGEKVLSLLAISRVFNMDKGKVKEIGNFALQTSFLGKLFTRYLLSTKNTFEREAKIWRKSSTVGRLEVVSVDEKQKTVTIRLYNVNFHPIVCDYLEGYFKAVGQMKKGEVATCEETRCYFKGEDTFHEFLLTW